MFLERQSLSFQDLVHHEAVYIADGLLPLPYLRFLHIYKNVGEGLLTASDNIRTQLYTAVICMEERSFTLFPLVLFPMKKL